MTEFIETQALIAMMENDHDGVVACMDQMLPGERYRLAVACRHLASYADGRYEGSQHSVADVLRSEPKP